MPAVDFNHTADVLRRNHLDYALRMTRAWECVPGSYPSRVPRGVCCRVGDKETRCCRSDATARWSEDGANVCSKEGKLTRGGCDRGEYCVTCTLEAAVCYRPQGGDREGRCGRSNGTGPHVGDGDGAVCVD